MKLVLSLCCWVAVNTCYVDYWWDSVSTRTSASTVDGNVSVTRLVLGEY